MKKITGKVVALNEPGKNTEIIQHEKMYHLLRSGFLEKLGEQLLYLSEVDKRGDWNYFISFYIESYINDPNENVKETKTSITVDKNKFYSYLFNQLMKRITGKEITEQ